MSDSREWRIMSRVTKLAVALSASSLAVAGLGAARAHAATSTAARPLLVGELGIEGGVFPGTFHPTAGTVEVEFYSVPLVLVKKVGRSGQFKLQPRPANTQLSAAAHRHRVRRVVCAASRRPSPCPPARWTSSSSSGRTRPSDGERSHGSVPRAASRSLTARARFAVASAPKFADVPLFATQLPGRGRPGASG